MAKKSLTTRIPLELRDMIKKIAVKNNISFLEAGREIEKEFSSSLNGKVRRTKLIKEIRF
jgi:hypothetical protein